MLNCLCERGVTADYHLQLNKYGVKKRCLADLDQEHANIVVASEVAQQARQLSNDWPAV